MAILPQNIFLKYAPITTDDLAAGYDPDYGWLHESSSFDDSRGCYVVSIVNPEMIRVNLCGAIGLSWLAQFRGGRDA